MCSQSILYSSDMNMSENAERKIETKAEQQLTITDQEREREREREMSLDPSIILFLLSFFVRSTKSEEKKEKRMDLLNILSLIAHLSSLDFSPVYFVRFSCFFHGSIGKTQREENALPFPSFDSSHHSQFKLSSLIFRLFSLLIFHLLNS